MSHLPEKPKNKFGRRRYNLWVEDPHCYWCGKKLKWKETTLDHVNQRTKLGNERRPRWGATVLSCEPCNNERQVKEFEEMNQIQKWKRTKNYPGFKRAWNNPDFPLYAKVWLIWFYFKKFLTFSKTFTIFCMCLKTIGVI